METCADFFADFFKEKLDIHQQKCGEAL